MPLTKTTPTDVIIKDFENSDNPKFAGKSKEKRKEMAIAASYTVKESVELDESRRIVSKHESGNRKAVVYKDPESDEHQVEFYHNGAHQKDATYFTSGDKEGKDDATGTAKAYINKANIYQKESVETLTQALMSEDKEAIKEAFAAAISQKIRAKLHEMKSEMFEEVCDTKPTKTRAELNAAKDALEDKRQAKKDDPYAEVKEPKSK